MISLNLSNSVIGCQPIDTVWPKSLRHYRILSNGCMSTYRCIICTLFHIKSWHLVNHRHPTEQVITGLFCHLAPARRGHARLELHTRVWWYTRFYLPQPRAHLCTRHGGEGMIPPGVYLMCVREQNRTFYGRKCLPWTRCQRSHYITY